MPERRNKPLRPRARRADAAERGDTRARERAGAIVGVTPTDVERRYASVRAALERDELDAALVCGSEYSGFEGAVTYLSGFQIVHRYAYVVLPLEGDPSIVFPSEARYVGEHGTSWIEDQVFADRPGDWLPARPRGAAAG